VKLNRPTRGNKAVQLRHTRHAESLEKQTPPSPHAPKHGPAPHARPSPRAHALALEGASTSCLFPESSGSVSPFASFLSGAAESPR